MTPPAAAPAPPTDEQEPSDETTLRTRDGLSLFCRRWPAAGRPRAQLALLHGLADHGGRYDAFARRLNAARIGVHAVDLRGHGRSPGARAFVERFDDLLLDADALVDAAVRDAPHVPLFLMGHSMGGTLAALWALERDAARGRLAGLILSSPALAALPRLLLAFAQLAGRWAPQLGVRRVDLNWLSRDAERVEATRADRLCYHGRIRVRSGAELLGAMARVQARAAELHQPTLVIHGGADRLAAPRGSEAFVAALGSADKVLMRYADSRHETLNDLDRERVTDDLIGWIETCLEIERRS